MLVERKEILYSDGELRAAVIDYCLRHEVALPNADIENFTVKTDDKAGVSIEITYKPPHEDKIVVINQSQIAAALINYCRLMKIPLPRIGLKSLTKFEENGIALRVRIDRTPKRKK